jgi:hypothetical protein
MSISHWGVFPGWYEPVYEFGKGYPMSGTGRSVYCPADWHQFCLSIDAIGLTGPVKPVFSPQ